VAGVAGLALGNKEAHFPKHGAGFTSSRTHDLAKFRDGNPVTLADLDELPGGAVKHLLIIFHYAANP
jgi:hypothetical protein